MNTFIVTVKDIIDVKKCTYHLLHAMHARLSPLNIYICALTTMYRRLKRIGLLIVVLPGEGDHLTKQPSTKPVCRDAHADYILETLRGVFFGHLD